jgi:hypothetical protein
MPWPGILSASEYTPLSLNTSAIARMLYGESVRPWISKAPPRIVACLVFE